jgi:LysM repeat protein
MAQPSTKTTPAQQPPEAAAVRHGKLIRVLRRLATLTDRGEAQAFQAAVDALQLRYSVLSREGRLEFIADLISAGGRHLRAAEKKALRLLSEQLRTADAASGPFAGFAHEYLRQALSEQCGRGSAPAAGRSYYGASMGRILMALSLAGLLASGCAQKKQQTAALPAGLRPAPQSVPAAAAPQPYTVQPGDSVLGIARKQAVDATELVRLNNLTYNQKRKWYNLYPGQVLLLPGRIAPAAAAQQESLSLGRGAQPNNSTCHLVSKGETLDRISKKYQVPIRHLIEQNNIQDPKKIRYGTLLKIAKPAAPQASAGTPFRQMSTEHKVSFLQQRTIHAGHPYLKTLVEACDEFNIDPRLYAALIWEESWFNKNAVSQDNCQRLVQLDPRFHAVSNDDRENFRKSLGYLKHEFTYYLKKGFDRKSAAICALAAYNGGNTRIRGFINEGKWDGRDVATIPLQETKEYVARVLSRCAHNYNAVL